MKDLNLTINQVMAVLLRAFDYIDVRLVDHGQRVAYIVYKMLQANGSYPKKVMQEICIVAALHDAGAYKTEEIDQMVQFESKEVFDHSIYGYLFIKYMSPLEKWADVILYHHMNDDIYRHLSREHREIASLIHLADRMDVMMLSKERWANIGDMRKELKKSFAKKAVKLFLKAKERYGVVENISSGSYLKELNDFLSDAEYSDAELLEFIRMIAYSIDFRSETTVSHVVTTASVSVELGKLLGLDEIELRKVQLGAYLHDIGKISTPLEILEKPGKLNSEEMRIMREHIAVTGKILKDRIHEEVYHIAFRHHEKIDGSGYPKQLMGDQLTLNDRIVAVADIISALAGRRSYKDSFSKEAVIEILCQQRDAGKLCGRVTDAAIGNYDRIMEASGKNIREIAGMYDNISKDYRHIKSRFEAKQWKI